MATNWVSPRELLISFEKFNSQHDEIGRFATSGSGTSGSSATSSTNNTASDPVGALTRYRQSIGSRSRSAEALASLPSTSNDVERTLTAHGSDDLLHSPDSTHISQDYVAGVKGIYNDVRRSQQNQILNAYREKAKGVPAERRAIIMGGLGGAGKSSTIAADAREPDSVAGKLGIQFSSYDEHGNGIGEPSNFVVLNPDNIKEEMAKLRMVPKIGDLSPMEATVFTHEEASSMTKDLATEMLAQGKNVIWDVTLNSVKSGSSKIADLRAQGYHIAGAFVDVSTQRSLENARSRHEHGQERWRAGIGNGGRYVPSGLIVGAADPSGRYRSENRAAFEKLKQEGGFDQTVTIDNEAHDRRLIGESGRNDVGKLPIRMVHVDAQGNHLKVGDTVRSIHADPGTAMDGSIESLPHNGSGKVDVYWVGNGVGTRSSHSGESLVKIGSLPQSQSPRHAHTQPGIMANR